MIETIKNNLLKKIDNVILEIENDNIKIDDSIKLELKSNIQNYSPDNFSVDNEINKYIDHTYLKADTSFKKIDQLINEYFEYNFASICIPPAFVGYARSKNENLKIATVIGFPLGYTYYRTKINETEQAIDMGANEIDMVINIAFLKEKKFFYVFNEIYEIKNLLNEKILKVIIETCYLTFEELIAASILSYIANADYIKTSTGFGTYGATLEDVIAMKMIYGSKGVKASGGIRDNKFAKELLKHGATRLGTSSSIKILN